jgi:hypothetical protein
MDRTKIWEQFIPNKSGDLSYVKDINSNKYDLYLLEIYGTKGEIRSWYLKHDVVIV